MNFLEEIATAAIEWRNRFGAIPQKVFLGVQEFDRYQRERPKNPGWRFTVTDNTKSPTHLDLNIEEATLEVVPVKYASYMGFGI